MPALPSSRDVREPAGLHHLQGMWGEALPDLIQPAGCLPEGRLEAGWLRQGAKETDVRIYGTSVWGHPRRDAGGQCKPRGNGPLLTEWWRLFGWSWRADGVPSRLS